MSKKIHIFKSPSKGETPVKVISKLLDRNLPNRLGHQIPKYIVIHEVSLGTGCRPKTYNMEHYERKIIEDAKKGSQIGYHYLVGDKEVWQFLEDDVATLMLKHNITIENVITHKEMQIRYGDEEKQKNPKQCPGRLLAGFRGTMQDYKNEIKRCLIHGWLFEE